MAMPVTIVGRAGVVLTARLTRTCSRMIVPALMTVTCSASKTNVQGRPTDRNSEVIAALTGPRSTKSRRYHSTDPKFWKYRIQNPEYTTIMSMKRASPSTSAAPSRTSFSFLVLSGRGGSA